MRPMRSKGALVASAEAVPVAATPLAASTLASLAVVVAEVSVVSFRICLVADRRVALCIGAARRHALTRDKFPPR